MSIEAMKQAKEAFELLDRRGGLGLDVHEYIRTKIESLRQAIEQAEKREVARLSDVEITECWEQMGRDLCKYTAFARAIENRLKEQR